MRKILLVLLFVITSITLNAQLPERLSFSTSIGTGISMNPEINNRFSAGVGSGISFYEKALIPLFADVKFAILKPRKFTPYLECSVGYSFAPSKNANGGFYLNPSVGVQYKIHNKIQLFCALGYELQKLERLKRYENSLLITELAEKLNHNSISLKIGFIY